MKFIDPEDVLAEDVLAEDVLAEDTEPVDGAMIAAVGVVGSAIAAQLHADLASHGTVPGGQEDGVSDTVDTVDTVYRTNQVGTVYGTTPRSIDKTYYNYINYLNQINKIYGHVCGKNR